jgi:hypothetical protein
VIRINDTPAWYVTIVIGAEGVQHGLVLDPGGAPRHAGRVAARRTDAGTGREHPVLPRPAGRSARYGWPAGADLTLVWLTTGLHRLADLDRTAVRRLTVAITAILAPRPPTRP